MAGTVDFERAWLAKFARGLREAVGEEMCAEVMDGSEGLSSDTAREEVMRWTEKALRRLDRLVDTAGRRAILTGCGCQYPVSELRPIREAYEGSAGDIQPAHRMLQEKFESFLVDSLGLETNGVEEIVQKGWGLAGVLQGDTIVAIKIPKSGNLVAYLEETDPQRQRQLYCHCPRIREVLEGKDRGWADSVAELYCYCGAGFYKGIWEEILQRRLEVEVLESVLRGDDVCRIAVYLTPHAVSSG
jgi:hypothetical protein